MRTYPSSFTTTIQPTITCSLLNRQLQNSRIAGKVQFGIAWWFLDQKEGIGWQLNALSEVGLLSRFVWMATESRSFMLLPQA
jgi:glucuronate isomerase